MTLIPTIYNADTLGIRPDLVGRPITQLEGPARPRVQGQGLDPQHPVDRHHGCRHGLRSPWARSKYGDKGNMTKAEIDKTIAFLIEAKKAGQFRAFWKTFDESVNLMASGEVVIQSMWSPAVAAVRAQGHPLRLPAAGGRLPRLGRRPRHRQASHRARARRGLRIHQLVPVRLGRRLSQPPGLLLRRARHRQGAHEPGRMGLLDGGQAGGRPTSSAPTAR